MALVPREEMLKKPLDVIQSLLEKTKDDPQKTSLHDQVTVLFRNAVYSKDFGCLKTKTELVPTVNSYQKQQLWQIPPNSIVRVAVSINCYPWLRMHVNMLTTLGPILWDGARCDGA